MEVFLKGSINDIYTRGWWFWNQWTNIFWPFAHIDEDSPHQRWSLPPRRWLTADKWPQPWTCYNRVFKTVGESFGCPQVNHGHLGERGCWNRIDTLFLRSCIKTCVYLTACDKIINLLKKKRNFSHYGLVLKVSRNPTALSQSSWTVSNMYEHIFALLRADSLSVFKDYFLL